MREDKAPEIYGFRWLTPEEKSQVRIGTRVAFRCLEASDLTWAQGKPFWFETPKRMPGKPSLFKLPEAIALAEKEEVVIEDMVQCPLGARHYTHGLHDAFA